MGNKAKKRAWEQDTLHETLAPGQKRLPEERRYEKGTVLWAIGEPPSEVAVEWDSGHPRWLTIRSSCSGGEVTWVTTRASVRTTRRRAAKAMAIELRKEIAWLLKRAEAMETEARR